MDFINDTHCILFCGISKLDRPSFDQEIMNKSLLSIVRECLGQWMDAALNYVTLTVWDEWNYIIFIISQKFLWI